jgi:hypothetical protein
VTLVVRPKLTLNRNNNHYFQNYLVPLPLGHLPQRGFRASEHLLRKAFNWFDKQVADYSSGTAGDAGRRLAQFTEDLSDCLFFTIITVTDVAQCLQGVRDPQRSRRAAVHHRLAEELLVLVLATESQNRRDTLFNGAKLASTTRRPSNPSALRVVFNVGPTSHVLIQTAHKPARDAKRTPNRFCSRIEHKATSFHNGGANN